MVNLPYLDFAKMIAKAVSGHVRTTSKEAFIEVDGQAFKQRIHKFLDAAYKLAPEAKVGQTPIPTMNEDGDEMMSYTVRTNSVPVFKPSIKLMDSVISGMANQEVESAFSFLGSSAKVSLTGRQDLQSSAVEYLRASAGVMPAQSSGGPVRRGGGANNSNPANSLINSVNPNSPGEFEVSSGMGLQLKLNLRNMRGRGNQPDRSYSLTILPN